MNRNCFLNSLLIFIFVINLFNISWSHGIKPSNNSNFNSEKKLDSINSNIATQKSDSNLPSIIQATSISPTNGPINSITRLSIHGIGFSLFPKLFVHFDVTEGPYEVVQVIAITDTLIEVDTPRHLSFGKSGRSVLISVYTHPDVVLQSSVALIFRFYSLPIINVISPNHAGMSGGSELSIFGIGLFASEDLKCLFQSKDRSKVVDASYTMKIFDITKIKNYELILEDTKKLKEMIFGQSNNISENEMNIFIYNVQNSIPMPSIICECPSWTVSETVSLSISFNGVQYHLCTSGFTFYEESSLFGNVAHVVKERDSPSEVISEDDENKSKIPTNSSVSIPSEVLLKSVNSKTNSHISHNIIANDIKRYTDSSGNTYALSNPINASLLQSDYGLFLEFVIILYSSFIFGTTCKYIGLPLLLGYIIGGYIVGPSGFGCIAQPIQIISIAQIGVCLILFSLGLEFSVRRVLSIGKSVIYCACSSLIVFISLCGIYSFWVGTPINEGIFIGSFISMSSTAVVISELQLESNESMLTIGILILQDLLLGIVLALIPALQRSPVESPVSKIQRIHGNSINTRRDKINQLSLIIVYFCLFFWRIIRPFILLLLFIAISLFVKTIIFPLIFYVLFKTKNREIILIGVISIMLGISSLTEYLGLSMEMGSFVAGLMLSSQFSDEEVNSFRHDFIQSIESLKWLFSMLFFASIGLMIDATFIWDNYWTIGYVCLLISIIKFIVNCLIFFSFGHSIKISTYTSVMLANLGEFGFVLASKGVTLGIVSRKVYLILVATTVVSLLSTPIFLRVYSIFKGNTVNVPQYEINYRHFNNFKTNGVFSVLHKISSFVKNFFFNNRGKVFKLANLFKSWRITGSNNSNDSSSFDEYNFDIYIKNKYLSSRFQDYIIHSNSVEAIGINLNYNFPFEENELADLGKKSVSNELKFGNEESSISLEKIDEFTLAHVTNLGKTVGNDPLIKRKNEDS
ncbi:sodium:calcium exchanger [Cryptosporidium felis]|nr:sodium:calcium exchanger [Cryptosporidium felis]